MLLVSTSSKRISAALRTDWGRRPFSLSCRHQDHYRTLGVPPQATKAQIKSHFYQLSKKHHPDVADDPKSKDIFAAVSEAYAILSNDRERRAYDRTLSQQQQRPTSHSPYSRTSGPRTPRATNAWEYSYRARSTHHRNPPPGYQSKASSQQHKPPGQHYSAPEPRMSYHQADSFSRTGYNSGYNRKAEEAARELDRMRNESGLLRAAQVLGFMILSFAIFGGWGGQTMGTKYRPPELSRTGHAAGSHDKSASDIDNEVSTVIF